MDSLLQSQNTQSSSHIMSEFSKLNLRSQIDSEFCKTASCCQDNVMPIYPLPNSPVPVMRLHYDERKFLSTARVVQGNIVCVFNLPPHLEEGLHLKDYSHFGRYGPVVKVTLRRKITKNKAMAAPPLTQKGAVSAFIVYRRCEDALKAIISLSKMKIAGRQLKATLGSAVYCKNALRGLACNEQNCVKLHFKCAPEATFNAEQMANGLHIAYQRKKLIEIYQMHFANWPSSSATSNEPSAQWISPVELEEYLTDLASMEFSHDGPYISDNIIDAAPKQNFFNARGNLGYDGLESRRPTTLSSNNFVRQMILSPRDLADPNLKVETMEPGCSLSEGSSPLSELLPKGEPLQLSPRQQQMLLLLRRSACGEQTPHEYDLKTTGVDWDAFGARSNSWPTESTTTRTQSKLLIGGGFQSWLPQQSATDSGFGSTFSCSEKRSCLGGLLYSDSEVKGSSSGGATTTSPLLTPETVSEAGASSDGEHNTTKVAPFAGDSSDESGLESVSPPDSGLMSSSALDFDPVEAAKHGLAHEMLCESAVRLAELAVQSLDFVKPAQLPGTSRETLKALIKRMNQLVRDQPVQEEETNEEGYQALVSHHQNLASSKQEYVAQLRNVIALLQDNQVQLPQTLEK
ncbi:hypothetical protein Ciccas_009797 [Cichlidogyrus casuarinus]|uniref:RRM domain-containing protein n=1 Tax=Cichlidogyrus casuarinus TaxID=1844966 RepID=A0ABD2PWQ7_9PLAT